MTLALETHERGMKKTAVPVKNSPGEVRVKFGISSLMLVVLAASIICGVMLQESFIAFAIGFIALAILLGRLVSQSGPRSLTVHETATEADAHLLRNYLADHGVKAWVEGGMAVQSYAGLFRPRVVVPEGQAELAKQIMHEFDTAVRGGMARGSDAERAAHEPGDDRELSSAARESSIGPFGCSPAAVEEVAWPSDLPALLRRFAQVPYMLFFDSARAEAPLGRYSSLTADPYEVILSRRGGVVSVQAGQSQVMRDADPIVILADRLDRYAAEPIPGVPPFQGGAAGLFSYELCHQFERLPRAGCDEFEVPDLAIGLYDWVVALDHERRCGWIIATGWPATSAAARRNRATARIRQVKEWLESGNEQQACGTRPTWSNTSVNASSRLAADLYRRQWPIGRPIGSKAITSNFSRDQYLSAVERAINYIHAGDVYQVNLSQRLLAPLNEWPIELYLRLRQQNPAPFAGYFDLGNFVIASASPERFLRVSGGEVETRPIKGTRPRWTSPEADMYSAGELRESDKDRAENVMIVDLLRNDLGRVCEFGSVRVTDPLRLESYQFVHHLVSEVRGRLRADCGPLDLLRAAFPGGSVTGAPKIRAMQIIAELEPTVRGPYCGALGYIGFDGSMDSNILIRTFTCSRGWVQFPVGGGIVAQSVPELEYEETLHKAEGLIRAIDNLRSEI
jgi:para-aminobenzoate synthetase component 1